MLVSSAPKWSSVQPATCRPHLLWGSNECGLTQTLNQNAVKCVHLFVWQCFCNSVVWFSSLNSVRSSVKMGNIQMCLHSKGLRGTYVKPGAVGGGGRLKRKRYTRFSKALIQKWCVIVLLMFLVRTRDVAILSSGRFV